MVSNLLLIGRILLISILPAFLLIIAGTDEFDYIFDGLIIKGVSLGQKKLTALIIGVALSAGLVPIENIWFRKRVRRLEGFFHDEIVRDLKEVYDHLLKGLLNADFQSTSYRLFLPKKTLRYYLPLRFGKQIVYKYHTLSGFHHDEIKPLEFTVFPNYEAQGLVRGWFFRTG